MTAHCWRHREYAESCQRCRNAAQHATLEQIAQSPGATWLRREIAKIPLPQKQADAHTPAP